MGLDNAPCGPLALVLVALVLSERCAKHPVRTRLQHVNPGSAIPGSGASSLPSNGATSVFKSIQLQSNAVQTARKQTLYPRIDMDGGEQLTCNPSSCYSTPELAASRTER